MQGGPYNESYIEIQRHLRQEIEWRSKTCLHSLYFLMTATGAILGLLFFRAFQNPGTLTQVYPEYYFNDVDKLRMGLLLISCLWAVGLAYILEKRTWITYIAQYLREVVEYQLYPRARGSLNDPHKPIGWENYTEDIIRPTAEETGARFHIASVEQIACISGASLPLAISLLMPLNKCGYTGYYLIIFHILILSLMALRCWRFKQRKEKGGKNKNSLSGFCHRAERCYLMHVPVTGS
jgi:hypothetical protein